MYDKDWQVIEFRKDECVEGNGYNALKRQNDPNWDRVKYAIDYCNKKVIRRIWFIDEAEEMSKDSSSSSSRRNSNEPTWDAAPVVSAPE